MLRQLRRASKQHLVLLESRRVRVVGAVVLLGTAHPMPLVNGAILAGPVGGVHATKLMAPASRARRPHGPAVSLVAFSLATRGRELLRIRRHGQDEHLAHKGSFV